MGLAESPPVILLAGGRSKRMGIDKALLNWHGKPLLRVLVERFQAAGFTVMIAGGTVERSKWLANIANIHANIAPDLPAHEGFGPLAGIEAGLLQTKAEVVGVVACDLPYAEPKLIKWLAKRMGAAEAVVPMLNDEPQPLHAVYARSCLPKLVAQLESQDKAVKSFLRHLEVLYVPQVEWQQVADKNCLAVHLNEPEDLQRWLEGEVIGLELSTSCVPALALVGFSESGKTSLIERLAKALTEKGYKVGIIKHHAHVDEEGKDTWRCQRAGAAIVGLVAPDGMALFLPEQGLTAEQAIERMLRQEAVDLVLVEGFKGSSLRKLLILPSCPNGAEAQKQLEELLSQIPDKSTVVGIVSDVKLAIEFRQFAHDEVDKLCDFIQNFL